MSFSTILDASAGIYEVPPTGKTFLQLSGHHQGAPQASVSCRDVAVAARLDQDEVLPSWLRRWVSDE